MKFEVALKIDEPANNKSKIIISIKEMLKEYFRYKNYGEDIEEYSILCICVGSSFNNFFKVNKPKYVDHRISKNRFTGEKIEMNKLFLNDIKFEQEEYDAFIKGTDAESSKIFAQKMIRSLSNLDSLPKKVKDFDKERFKSDMEIFFRAQKLIEL